MGATGAMVSLGRPALANPGREARRASRETAGRKAIAAFKAFGARRAMPAIAGRMARVASPAPREPRASMARMATPDHVVRAARKATAESKARRVIAANKVKSALFPNMNGKARRSGSSSPAASGETGLSFADHAGVPVVVVAAAL